MPGITIGAIILGLIQIQCTWTPEIATPIFSNERVTVNLRTFPNFHKPPVHPANLPSPLLENIFSGLKYTQEAGILQELLNSPSSKSFPVFSKAQIAFLAPHISLALAQATQEEFVDFSCTPTEASETWIKGSMGVFDSQILFLTIAISKSQPGAHPTRSSQQNALQDKGTLSFMMQEAIIPREKIQYLMNLQQHPYWIAVDLKTLLSGPAHDEGTDNINAHPKKNPESNNDEDPRIQKLEEKMNRLLEKIEEQHNEIQRLQGGSP